MGSSERGAAAPTTSGFAGEPVANLRVPARPDQLRAIRQAVEKAALACGCSAACAHDMVIAVDEACQNVIRHAYGEQASGELVLDIRCLGDRLYFHLVDFAPPVDIAAIKPRDLDELRPGGLGTHFIRECMDEVEFVVPPAGAGNHLKMSKKIT